MICDDCGIQTENPRGWAELNVTPKGIPVTLNLCCRCNKKREPKEPEADPNPSIQDTKTPYQVTGYLLWASGAVSDVHFPTRRSAVVTVLTDRWHVMEIYEDTEEGKHQLLAVTDYLSDVYKQLWRDSHDGGLNNKERVKWCSEHLFYFTPRFL